jgi:hypothetical protein
MPHQEVRGLLRQVHLLLRKLAQQLVVNVHTIHQDAVLLVWRCVRGSGVHGRETKKLCRVCAEQVRELCTALIQRTDDVQRALQVHRQEVAAVENKVLQEHGPL